MKESEECSSTGQINLTPEHKNGGIISTAALKMHLSMKMYLPLFKFKANSSAKPSRHHLADIAAPIHFIG